MTLFISYKNSNPESQCYLFIAAAQDYERFLGGLYQPLPSLSDSDRDFFLERYSATVQDYQRLNQNNKFFAMTPFSTRNTWQSSFYHGAESYARAQTIKEGGINFYSPEWFLWACKNLEAKVNLSDVKRARSDLHKFGLQHFYMAWQGCRFALSSREPQKKIPKNIRFFIASIWTKAGFEKWTQQGQDPFYGHLPRLLQEKSHSSILVYHSEGQSGNLESSVPMPAFNFTSLVNLGDWLRIFLIIFSFRVKIKNSRDFPKTAIKRDIQNSLANQVPLALISYFAVVRFLRSNPQADFLTLYENNCWEQGVLQAAHERGRKVTGLQHTAFAPSHLKMDNNIAEKMMPDKILTSGAESARILVDLMRHDPEKITIGGSLRYNFVPLLSKKNNRGKILVLLQGAPDDALLLCLLERHLAPEEVIVRAHPSWPVENKSSFLLSHDDLKTDLSHARVAIYTGTTAAFDALSAGVPVIHANMGSALSSDSLFILTDCPVKKTWSQQQDLKEIIMQIDSLSEQELLPGFETAGRYIRDYFSPENHIIEQVIDG